MAQKVDKLASRFENKALMYDLALVRHGQSQWNQKNLFTGHVDVGLSEQGAEEAKRAGLQLKAHGPLPTRVYTSCLKRAIKTAWLMAEQMDVMSVPIIKHKALNERHYGQLQGKDKAQLAEIHGHGQVQIWRRSFDVPPPGGESLEQTCQRVGAYWREVISPQVRAREKVLIVAHGNSLRGLLKILGELSAQEVTKLEIPTGCPQIVSLNENLRQVRSFYL